MESFLSSAFTYFTLCWGHCPSEMGTGSSNFRTVEISVPSPQGPYQDTKSLGKNKSLLTDYCAIDKDRVKWTKF